MNRKHSRQKKMSHPWKWWDYMEITELDGSGDIVIDELWQNVTKKVTKWPQGHRESEREEQSSFWLTVLEVNRNDTQRDI